MRLIITRRTFLALAAGSAGLAASGHRPALADVSEALQDYACAHEAPGGPGNGSGTLRTSCAELVDGCDGRVAHTRIRHFGPTDEGVLPLAPLNGRHMP